MPDNIISIETKRIYRVSSKQLRELFDIKGVIINVGLWRGRSDFMEKDPEKFPPDEDEWFIETKEKEFPSPSPSGRREGA